MAYYFGLLGIIVCIIHNQEAKLIENFQEENVIVFQLQNDGKGKWNNSLLVYYYYYFISVNCFSLYHFSSIYAMQTHVYTLIPITKTNLLYC